MVDEIGKKMKEVKDVPKDIQREIDMILNEDVYDLARVKNVLPLFDESVMQKVVATRKTYEDMVDEILKVLKEKEASGALIPENFEADFIKFRSNPDFNLGKARFALSKLNYLEFDRLTTVLNLNTKFSLGEFVRENEALAVELAQLISSRDFNMNLKKEANIILNSKVYDHELLSNLFVRAYFRH